MGSYKQHILTHGEQVTVVLQHHISLQSPLSRGIPTLQQLHSPECQTDPEKKKAIAFTQESALWGRVLSWIRKT